VDVDVSALGIGDSVHVSAISVSDLTILTEPEVTVATVVPPTVHVEEKPAEEVVAAAAEPSEPEVITKGKKEEGEAEEGKGGKEGKESKGVKESKEGKGGKEGKER
jgi:large subunit ribosomal protein L25